MKFPSKVDAELDFDEPIEGIDEFYERDDVDEWKEWAKELLDSEIRILDEVVQFGSVARGELASDILPTLRALRSSLE